MSFDADAILDRRKIRTKLTFWRAATFIILLLAVIGLGARLVNAGAGLSKQTDHIARVPISGFISGDRYGLKQLEKIAENDNIKAVILSINSPGGATTGGELMYQAIREIAEKKPVIASVDGLAASAAYMIALGADRIIAPNNALVGSIGVIFQYPDVTKLMSNVGVEMKEIKSSPLKAEPSPFNATPQEALDNIERSVLDSYGWFADLVKERRALNAKNSDTVLNGTIYTGRQSLALQLIDDLGHEHEALEWLQSEKKIDENLDVETWSLERPREDYLFGSQLFAYLLKSSGLDKYLRVSRTFSASQSIQALDGLLSVWHGPFGEK